MTPPFFIEQGKRDDPASWERMDCGSFATVDDAQLALADASRFPLNVSYRIVDALGVQVV